MQETILQFDRYVLACNFCYCQYPSRAAQPGLLPQAPLKCDCGHFYDLFGHDDSGWKQLQYLSDPQFKRMLRRNNGTHRNI